MSTKAPTSASLMWEPETDPEPVRGDGSWLSLGQRWRGEVR